MKLSELMSKIRSLVGEYDADIYLDIEQGEFGFTGDFNVFLDSDGDLTIRF